MRFKLGQKIIDKFRGKKKHKGMQENVFFKNTLEQYKSFDTKKRFSLEEKDFYICLGEDTADTSFDTHYEYHQAWAIRKIKNINPSKHVDVSSKITFNICLSAFIPVDFYDFRPARIYVDNLNCLQADLIQLHLKNNSIECLSCMHVVEHIGLGRYGDTLDPDGDLKAISELKRVVKKGGNLLFVVPVGMPRIQFNAHRIYSYEMIMEYFNDFKLVEFSLIPDDALEVGMIKNATAQDVNKQKYGCGCFWFRKGE